MQKPTKKTVADYCRAIARHLDTISGDFKTKKRVVDLLVNRVEVADRTVKIKTVIPSVVVGDSPAGRLIASTPLGQGKHNNTLEFELVTTIP